MYPYMIVSNWVRYMHAFVFPLILSGRRLDIQSTDCVPPWSFVLALLRLYPYAHLGQLVHQNLAQSFPNRFIPPVRKLAARSFLPFRIHRRHIHLGLGVLDGTQARLYPFGSTPSATHAESAWSDLC